LLPIASAAPVTATSSDPNVNDVVGLSTKHQPKTTLKGVRSKQEYLLGWIANMKVSNYLGREIDIAEYSVKDVDFLDICHRLSLECRWGGGCKRFYSVGEHSLWVGKVARMLGVPMLHGLLHDAHEAYLKDIPTPLKRYLPEWYGFAAKQIDSAIYERLELPMPTEAEAEVVHKADMIVAYIEASRLMDATHPVMNRIERPHHDFFAACEFFTGSTLNIEKSLMWYIRMEANAMGSQFEAWPDGMQANKI